MNIQIFDSNEVTKRWSYRRKWWAWKYNPLRMLVKFIMPFMSNMRNRYLGGLLIQAPHWVKPVSFESKVLAANLIAAHGAENSDIHAWATLMWPLREFTLRDVDREASRFLGRVHLAQLVSVPHQSKLLILQDQAEHLASE